MQEKIVKYKGYVLKITENMCVAYKKNIPVLGVVSDHREYNQLMKMRKIIDTNKYKR